MVRDTPSLKLCGGNALLPGRGVLEDVSDCWRGDPTNVQETAQWHEGTEVFYDRRCLRLGDRTRPGLWKLGQE